MGALTITQIENIPLIEAGDDLATIIHNAVVGQGIEMEDGDVLGITSKIVSKAEGRFINLANVTPSEKAINLSKSINRDARLVELVLSESKSIIRATDRAFIVEHKCGFICANAGIDRSNVGPQAEEGGGWYLLLPKNSDRSAQKISAAMKAMTRKQVGVIIIDSHGRPWRLGTVGTVVGTALVPTLVDLRGREDMFGYKLQITMVAAADELAGAVSLMMGQAGERVAAAHIRGFPYPFADASISDVLRPEEEDLFR